MTKKRSMTKKRGAAFWFADPAGQRRFDDAYRQRVLDTLPLATAADADRAITQIEHEIFACRANVRHGDNLLPPIETPKKQLKKLRSTADAFMSDLETVLRDPGHNLAGRLRPHLPPGGVKAVHNVVFGLVESLAVVDREIEIESARRTRPTLDAFKSFTAIMATVWEDYTGTAPTSTQHGGGFAVFLETVGEHIAGYNYDSQFQAYFRVRRKIKG